MVMSSFGYSSIYSESAPLAGIHPDIIQSHILSRLDGPTLATATCTSAALLSMCSADRLWRDICTSTWPSTAAFPSGHRSLYSDAFPASRPVPSAAPADTPELISAVDIYYDGAPLYSKVFATEARSAWFLSTPLRLELLGGKETVALPTEPDGGGGEAPCASRAAERLGVSWIVIDPARGRAVNVAGRAAVEAGRDWLSGDIQLRYASVAEDGEMVWCSVAVTCGGKEGGRLRVKEVSMRVEDLEGRLLSGAECLRVLGAAMEGGRRRSDGVVERESYQRFLRVRRRCREKNQSRERGLDMACAATGISIFFAFFLFFLLR
ncbi:F-box protein At2g27310-like [Salvia miltiorrhiza]|uniref:F-box protein At2g27310-like n=1 Tax=Salvia miltiorrhiza TaxID=226208 RepID=UPI0025ABF0AB|nr:F-box protein At2g27310-like [Salvia miltiorrhiza]